MDSLRKAELLKKLPDSQAQNARVGARKCLAAAEDRSVGAAHFRGEQRTERSEIACTKCSPQGARQKLDPAPLELLLALGTAEPGKVPASSNLEEARP